MPNAAPKQTATGAVLGYGRVSREGQDLAQQRAALRAAGCSRLFEEKASGGRWNRPELHRLLDHLRDGDVVVVWKLDRLSRSLKDLLHIMEKIGEAGAGFRSLTEHIARLRQTQDGRYGGPLTHRSYTTPWGTTILIVSSKLGWG